MRVLDSSIGVHSGPEGVGGGRSVLEAVSWVSVEIMVVLVASVVSVDKCWSGAGCRVTGFKSCSISVEVVGATSTSTSTLFHKTVGYNRLACKKAIANLGGPVKRKIN